MRVRKVQGCFRGLGSSSVYDKPWDVFIFSGDARSVGQSLTNAYLTILGVLNIKFPRSERRVGVVAKALLATVSTPLMQIDAFWEGQTSAGSRRYRGASPRADYFAWGVPGGCIFAVD
jgi:hypothetical protein